MAAAANAREPSHTHLYWLLTLMIVFWSLNYAIGKIALREFPALLLAAVRAGLAAVVILPIYFLRGRQKPFRWTTREVLLLLLLGIFGVALNQLFFVLGLSRTSVAHAAILIGLTPIQVLLLAAFAGQEKLTWRKVTGLAIALGGVAVIQIARDSTTAPSLLGDVCIVLSGLAFAIYSVVGKNVTARHDTVTMNTFAYVGGAVALFPIVLWKAVWSTRSFDYTRVSAGAWLAVAYMAVFASVVGYLIYNYALSRIPASRVSSFSYLQPLFAMMIAIPTLGEHLTAPLLFGGMMVLSGVYVTERA
jgi:drug/metabolite transporter (DMT)-like permease